MKKLLKQYGQRSQAKAQFLAMPKSERKEFVNFNLGNSDSVLKNSDLAIFITLI
jgi:hypothetical protein